MDPWVSRWSLEIVAGEGKCYGFLLYQHHGHRQVIWQTTDWMLPNVPLSQRLLLEEFGDLALWMRAQLDR